MNVNEEAAELLERAADGFESGRYGWTVGASHRRDSTGAESYCSTGALHYEAGLRVVDVVKVPDFRLRMQNYRNADRALDRVTPGMGVPTWNDYMAMGVGEVIDKMKEAAKKLRNGELA